MSKQDVLDSSWGKPTKINKSVYSWGTHEQWVYPNDNYLYFENGKLTSIQTNEQKKDYSIAHLQYYSLFIYTQKFS